MSNLSEREVFERATILSFATAQVVYYVEESYRRYPHLKEARIKPEELALSYIYNVFNDLKKPFPTLHESQINENVARQVSKSLQNSMNNGIEYTKPIQLTEKEKEELR